MSQTMLETPHSRKRIATPDKPFGDWGGPPIIIVYGDSGVGKSVDGALAYPGALALTLPTAMDSTIAVAGFAMTRRFAIDTLDQAIALVQAATALPRETRPPAVLVDDLSVLAEHQAQAMHDSGEYPMRGDGVYRFWGDLGDKITRLARLAVWAGMADIFNAHVRTPSNDREGFWKGGPMLPSKKLTRKIPHIANMVLRAGIDETRQHAPHPGVYICDLDPEWHMKNRYGLTGTLPMNLGELLRDAGFWLPRLPGLAWQDSWVETIATLLEQGQQPGELKDKIKSAGIKAGYHPLHVRWAWRDGLDRYAIRRRQHAIWDF